MRGSEYRVCHPDLSWCIFSCSDRFVGGVPNSNNNNIIGGQIPGTTSSCGPGPGHIVLDDGISACRSSRFWAARTCRQQEQRVESHPPSSFWQAWQCQHWWWQLQALQALQALQEKPLEPERRGWWTEPQRHACWSCGCRRCCRCCAWGWNP